MILTVARIDEVREAVEDGRIGLIESLVWTGVELPAALEAACCWWMWEQDSNQRAVRLLETWASQLPVLRRAWSILRGNAPNWPRHASQFGAPTAEMRLLSARSDLLQDQWTLFEDRFRRSLENHGFSSSFARALTGAFHEMADNVVQHSGKNPETSSPAIVGYQVRPASMVFAVADVGCGVLDSLRSNPAWADLSNSRDALLAAVRDHATRRGRTREDQGGGFREVDKSLADRNGQLRFRSGNGLLMIDGRGRESRNIMSGFVSPLIGLQLSVTCLLDLPGSIQNT